MIFSDFRRQIHNPNTDNTDVFADFHKIVAIRGGICGDPCFINVRFV